MPSTDVRTLRSDGSPSVDLDSSLLETEIGRIGRIGCPARGNEESAGCDAPDCPLLETLFPQPDVLELVPITRSDAARNE